MFVGTRAQLSIAINRTAGYWGSTLRCTNMDLCSKEFPYVCARRYDTVYLLFWIVC